MRSRFIGWYKVADKEKEVDNYLSYQLSGLCCLLQVMNDFTFLIGCYFLFLVIMRGWIPFRYYVDSFICTSLCDTKYVQQNIRFKTSSKDKFAFDILLQVNYNIH